MNLAILFAATLPKDPFIPLIASAAVGVAIFALVRTLFVALASEDLGQDVEWRYDINRINQLRRASPMYRLFQPVIAGFARINRRVFRDQLPEVNREIQAAGLTRFWLAEEYLGRIELISLMMAPFYAYACIDLMGPAGLVMALVC